MNDFKQKMDIHESEFLTYVVGKLLSPDAAWHKNNGGTLLKIGNDFRIDVGSNTLLHMHLRNVSSRIPIGTIGGGIYGGLK